MKKLEIYCFALWMSNSYLYHVKSTKDEVLPYLFTKLVIFGDKSIIKTVFENGKNVLSLP